MRETVFLFPGQLSERLGMGEWLLGRSARARETVREASEIAGVDLAGLMARGPVEDLRSDRLAPMAVLTLSVAWHRALLDGGCEPSRLLGASMGLYSAAVASGALSLRDAIRLLWEADRSARALQQDANTGMALVVGLRLEVLETELAGLLSTGKIQVSNVNSTAQVVLAGECAALDEAMGRIAGRVLRAERLMMSRPYHTSWMEPVARDVAALVESFFLRDPAWPIVYHHDGRLLRSADELRPLLSRQLCERCDFHRAARCVLASGKPRLVEVGPGDVLTRLLRWIDREVDVIAVEDPAGRVQIEAWLGGGRVQEVGG